MIYADLTSPLQLGYPNNLYNFFVLLIGLLFSILTIIFCITLMCCSIDSVISFLIGDVKESRQNISRPIN